MSSIVFTRDRGKLMDEIKMSQSCKYNFLETSWSSENAQKLCCSPVFPWLNSHCSQSTVSYANKVQLPLGSVAENNRQIHNVPSPTEGCPKDSVEHKCKKVGRKALDLQLPAEEYIGSEEGEASEYERHPEVTKVSGYFFNRISEVVHNRDEKPYPENKGVNSVHEDASISESLSKSFKGLADLNEPVKLEEEVALMSDGLVDVTGHEKVLCHDRFTRTKTALHISSKDIIQNTILRQGIEACSYNPLSEKQEREQQWISSFNVAGQSCSYLDSFARLNSAKNLPISSIHELEQIYELQSLHSLNHNNQKIWSGRKKFSVGSFERTQGPTNYVLLGPSSASHMCAPHQLVLQADMVISKSSPVACKTPVHDLGRNPIAVQALPCFSTSAPFSRISRSLMKMPKLDGDKFHHSIDLRSDTKLDSQSFLLSSSCGRSSISFDNLKGNDNHGLAFSHDLGKYVEGSENMQTSKNLNLNFMAASCSSGVTGGEKKFEDMTRGWPWLQEKPVDEGKPNIHKISTEVESVLLQAHYSGCTHDIELRVEENDVSRKEKILGFPIDGKQNTSCGLHASSASPSKTVPNQFDNEDTLKMKHITTSDVNLSCSPVPDLGERVTADEHTAETGQTKKYEDFVGHFDLNSCRFEDEHMLTGNDLQAPVSPENKESLPPRGESDENQVETLFQLPEDAELQEEKIRIAAEALVSISVSAAGNHLKMTTCQSFESSSSDSLYWFAGIVSSMVYDSKNEFRVVLSNESDDLRFFPPDDIDYFEAMTLQLTETEAQDCCCKSNGEKEEETGSPSLSMPPRKGRTKRGRQRKDFQSEILPSLASLSRYEVTEDLQTIGGLIEAAGTCLESGFMRSTGRNGLAGGRRRSAISAFNVTSKPAGLLFKQPASNSELDTERRGLTIGWGNKSRRQGQRYPTTNPQAIVWQVYY
ncbi:DUF863 family protein [Quillaja saponaria]|uniref:DUF863 family protein n=1 Tax=Quillaja saponaria TaxID=32244 RepID=A0AAD7VK48_QUISA|nr:DUF863 family protein [Quillaja saponaria]